MQRRCPCEWVMLSSWEQGSYWGIQHLLLSLFRPDSIWPPTVSGSSMPAPHQSKLLHLTSSLPEAQAEHTSVFFINDPVPVLVWQQKVDPDTGILRRSQCHPAKKEQSGESKPRQVGAGTGVSSITSSLYTVGKTLKVSEE